MRTRPARVLAIALAALVVVACAPLPSPSPAATAASTTSPSPRPSLPPSPSPSPSVLPADQLADPPPPAVQGWLDHSGLGFRPLTAEELARVKVTAATAERVALDQRPAEYGSEGGKIVWTHVGCVFLGYYGGMAMPSVGYVPPEFPAYLVQVIGAPVAEFPGTNIQVVVIDAETGEAGGMFSSGTTVLGTTCGAAA